MTGKIVVSANRGLLAQLSVGQCPASPTCIVGSSKRFSHFTPFLGAWEEAQTVELRITSVTSTERPKGERLGACSGLFSIDVFAAF